MSDMGVLLLPSLYIPRLQDSEAYASLTSVRPIRKYPGEYEQDSSEASAHLKMHAVETREH